MAERLVMNKGRSKDGFDRPDGVLLFLRPDGRRQDRARQGCRRVLFGDEKKMIRIDMSECRTVRCRWTELIGMPAASSARTAAAC